MPFQIDSTLLDVVILTEEGSDIARPSVTTCVELASRTVFSSGVDRTPRLHADHLPLSELEAVLCQLLGTSMPDKLLARLNAVPGRAREIIADGSPDNCNRL
jgi:hypothetical protein